MSHLSLALLGPMQVALAGEPVTALKLTKVRAMLAYLAVEAERPHSRETLAGLLWPDYARSSALTSLRSALASLRSAAPHLRFDPSAAAPGGDTQDCSLSR